MAAAAAFPSNGTMPFSFLSSYPPSSTSSFKDRTSEFLSLSEKIHGIPTNRNICKQQEQQQQQQQRVRGVAARDHGDDDDDDSHTRTKTRRQSASGFNKKASKIGLAIHETSQKIARLSILAKKSTIFDDPFLEIQELTALIKNDISALNAELSELQLLQSSEVADGTHSSDVVVHATTICDDLNSRLMGTTKQFKDVLTTRTENLKADEKRKQFFSTNALREGSFPRRQNIASEPPPWASSVLSSDGVQIANQLRRRSAAESSPTEQMEVSMMQQLAPRHENYIQSRATALQSVESTISELGGIFTQLATMVAQQGDLTIRIDDNMDESLANVENARGALVKHLGRISSNRWLLIKIFIVIIIFLTVFVFFVA